MGGKPTRVQPPRGSLFEARNPLIYLAFSLRMWGLRDATCNPLI